MARACHRVHGVMTTFTVKGMPQPANERSEEDWSSSDVDLSSESESDDLLSMSNEWSEKDRSSSEMDLCSESDLEDLSSKLSSSDMDLSSESELEDLSSKFAQLSIF